MDAESEWILDAVVALLSTLMVVGVVLDFRRHAVFGLSFAEEGFFTAEHVFFYSMYLAITGVLVAATFANRLDGDDWMESVPVGYGWAVVGILVFGLGGVADLAWHSTFGFEEGVEALTSPSHLALGAGGAILLASPLRAAWYRRDHQKGLPSIPIIVSTSLVLSFVALFAGYLNPIWQLYHVPVSDPAVQELYLVLGIISLAVFPLILLAGATTLTRRFDLPPAALTATFLGPGLASASVEGTWAFVVPAIAAGLVGDGVVHWRRPTDYTRRSLRLFGALVPMAFVAAYHAVAAIRGDLWWSVHVWVGTVAIAGIAGVLLTYAIEPGDR